jgi:hypothetical protein
MTAALREEFAQFVHDWKAARPEKFGPRPDRWVRPKPDLNVLRAELAELEKQLKPGDVHGTYTEAMDYHRTAMAIANLRSDIAHYERQEQQQ